MPKDWERFILSIGGDCSWWGWLSFWKLWSMLDLLTSFCCFERSKSFSSIWTIWIDCCVYSLSKSDSLSKWVTSISPCAWLPFLFYWFCPSWPTTAADCLLLKSLLFDLCIIYSYWKFSSWVCAFKNSSWIIGSLERMKGTDWYSA